MVPGTALGCKVSVRSIDVPISAGVCDGGIVFLECSPENAAAQSGKYQKYLTSDDANLLLLCVKDDQGCYFYAGR